MEFEKSSLYQEVLSILNSDAKTQYSWKVTLHIGGKDYDPLKVLSIDDLRDYELNYTPEIMVKIDMPGGMFAYDVYPNQNDLEITLTRRPMYEVSDALDRDKETQSERYKAVMRPTANQAMEANASNTPTRDALDLTKIETVEFQLIDKAIDQLRMLQVGRTYTNTTVQTAIRSILTIESRKIVVDDEYKVKGVDMVAPDNEREMDYITINDGIPLVLIPQYIHELCGGVYSSGLGYFFQDNFWYVYPCYDTERYDEAQHTFTVINVPPNKFPQVERTYRKDGDNLSIIATGEVRFRDNSSIKQLEEGNGVRFTDANRFVEGLVKTGGNKAIVSRALNNSEFTAVTRLDGIKNAMVSKNAITANPYLEYSKLALRSGSIFSFTWENSDPTLIKPGMVVKVMYLEEDEIVEAFGVLLKIASYHHMTGVGYTAGRYRTNTAMSVFIKNPNKGTPQ